MTSNKFARRDVLKGATALTAAGMGGTIFAAPVRAQAPAAAAITPALIEAAKKEGKVVFYTAMDLTLAQRLGRSFEAASSRVSRRSNRATSSQSMSPTPQISRTSSIGSGMDCSHRTCRKRS